MAGGIDWFRWHHSTVTDQKFGLIGRKAGASVAEVIAVWACLLESASCSETRGLVGAVDFESMDFALGMDEGKAERVYGAMVERNLIDCHGHIVQWPKRQPKREDDTAADRKRRQRERDHEASIAGVVTGPTSRNVTQGHADVTQGHDRGEESRGEKEIPAPTVLVGSAVADADTGGQVLKLPSRVPCPAERLVEIFHESCPALPRVMALNDTRRKHLTARWREVDADAKLTSAEDGIEIFRAVFAGVNKSDFLCGRTQQRGGRTWQASFDWLIQPTNFLKVCEGHYENERRRAM